MENISYKVRVYESVDNRSLSWVISQKSTENKIHAVKGQQEMCLLLRYELLPNLINKKGIIEKYLNKKIM